MLKRSFSQKQPYKILAASLPISLHTYSGTCFTDLGARHRGETRVLGN